MPRNDPAAQRPLRGALRAPSGNTISVTLAPDADRGSALAAGAIVDAVAALDRPRAVLGLATGRSVVRLYEHLVEAFRNHEIDPARVTTFNLDEYVGLDADHPASFRRFMREQLFAPAAIPAEASHFPPTGEPDAATESYEDRIRAAGGIDLQLLGLGVNGHIAFNEPGSPIECRTRRVRLDPVTLHENAPQFRGPGAMPTEAITMGIATILETRRVLLVAWGAGKASALRRAFLEPATSDCPASFLQQHPGPVDVIVDAPAGAAIRGALSS